MTRLWACRAANSGLMWPPVSFRRGSARRCEGRRRPRRIARTRLRKGENRMSTVTCPHCGAATPPGAFCESCGKALPSAVPTTPRVVTGDVLPQSAAGQQMLGEELAKQTKKAAYALLAVGVIQATCGAVLLGT